jgi:polysaccharide biosynthesis protein PslH
MKILLVCNKFPYPPRDGGSLATYNMARGLVEAGNSVDLLAMNTSRHYTRDGVQKIDIRGLNRIRDVFVNNTPGYGGLLYNLLFLSIPYNAGKFVNAGFNKALSSMLQERDYDIVQMEGLYLAGYIDTIRKNTKARVVYRAHNVEHVIWRDYSNRKNNLKRLYFHDLGKRIRVFEKDFLNRYDLLATFTKDDLEILNALGNIKPAIVAPFGIYPGEFPAAEREQNDVPSLQYIGALDWRPNIEALNWFIDNVWTVMKKKYPALRFFVAGRNSNSAFARKMARAGIDFMGEVISSKEFLARGGIFVAPLISGSGMRVKIIEAFCMNKPVVASSAAAKGLPVENGVNILVADSPGEFAAHIGSLISDPHFAMTLGQGGRDLTYRFFNNTLIAEEVTLFYKNHCI